MGVAPEHAIESRALGSAVAKARLTQGGPWHKVSYFQTIVSSDLSHRKRVREWHRGQRSTPAPEARSPALAGLGRPHSSRGTCQKRHDRGGIAVGVRPAPGDGTQPCGDEESS